MELPGLLAHVALIFIMRPGAFPTDAAKNAFLASHFEGLALEWQVTNSAANPALLGGTTYTDYVDHVQEVFGADDTQRQLAANHRFMTLRHTSGPVRDFLAEFDVVADQAKLGKVTKVMVLPGKLKPEYRRAIETSGQLLMNWTVLRSFVINLGARMESGDDPSKRSSSRPRCGKCRKRGHTATQCSKSAKE